MRTLKHNTLTNQLRTTQSNLGIIATHADDICRYANEHRDDALTTTTLDTPITRTSSSSHPERHAGRSDPIAAAMVLLDRHIHLAQYHADAARAAASILMVATSPADRAAVSVVAADIGTAGQGFCVVCDQYQPGSRTLRLVAGRCPACFRYWIRHHRLNDRPRQLWETDDGDVA